MKYIFKRLFFICFGLFFLLSSCQKEAEILIDESDEETITANSVLTNLIIRSSQNTGELDDIIDGSSCVEIILPITIFANGQKVILENEDDFELVEDIFDQFPNDTDTIEIVFPISVILADFTQFVVSNDSELTAIVDLCENDVEESIYCVDFIYPITFFTFNSDQQQTGSITLNNDEELYNYLDELGNNDIISIQYPLSITVSGELIQINNNQEFLQVLSDVECTVNDNAFDINQFEETLTTDSWFITYFFDDFDETSNYNGYEFSFNSDNSTVASNGSNVINGSWNVTNNDIPKLELFYGTSNPFDELDEDWVIIEATSDILRLRNVSGGDGSTDYLTFGRTPNNGGSNQELNNFIETLIIGKWFVTLFEDNGDNETSSFSEFEFTFDSNGSAMGINANTTVFGYWTAEANNQNINFILNFDSSGSGNPLNELNDNWNVIEFSEQIVRLDDSTNGGSGVDKLTFEREPSGGGGPDPQELREYMISGSWFIFSYLDDGNDETADYAGFNYNFMEDNSVNASNGTESVSGIWNLTTLGDDLNMEFDMDSPLNGTDDEEYKVVQYSSNSVTFITRDSSGNVEDTLVFNKN